MGPQFHYGEIYPVITIVTGYNQLDVVLILYHRANKKWCFPATENRRFRRMQLDQLDMIHPDVDCMWK